MRKNSSDQQRGFVKESIVTSYNSMSQVGKRLKKLFKRVIDVFNWKLNTVMDNKNITHQI